MFQFGRFEAMTFDCYGTLVDWESGILRTLGRMLAPQGIDVPPEQLLTAFGRHEAALEAGPYLSYREVLTGTARGVAADLGVGLDEADAERFAASVAEWPPFPDSADALARLQTRFRLGVITNCDDDLFAASNAKLGLTFDWVVTAQQVGSYKPDRRNFEVALARIGLPPQRILHVAQSLYHDHVPAQAMGLATAWVDRRHDREGFGATPPAKALPNLVVPDMATFAALAVPG